MENKNNRNKKRAERSSGSYSSKNIKTGNSHKTDKNRNGRQYDEYGRSSGKSFNNDKYENRDRKNYRKDSGNSNNRSLRNYDEKINSDRNNYKKDGNNADNSKLRSYNEKRNSDRNKYSKNSSNSDNSNVRTNGSKREQDKNNYKGRDKKDSRNRNNNSKKSDIKILSKNQAKSTIVPVINEPEYFKEFKCIGGSCENSCCIGWDVDIDKNSFKEYMKVNHPKMKEMFKKNLYNNEYCTDPEIDYGKVRIAENGRCPFLDDNNLCVIYSELGEGYLSNVCSHFPRIMNKTGAGTEISLDIACPEAARLVLSRKEGIKFTVRNENLKKTILSGDMSLASGFTGLRDYTIEVLQLRKKSLKERLYALGKFLENVKDEAVFKEKTIVNSINNFNPSKAAGKFERKDKNSLIQITFFNEFIEALEMENNISDEEFRNFTRKAVKVYKNLKPSEKEAAYKKYAEEFAEEHSYIFENYLVNFVYNNLFPFSESEVIFDGYIMLVLRYSCLMYYLTALYTDGTIRDEEKTIKFINRFAKVLEHDNNYMEILFEEIKENLMDNMEFAEEMI